MTNVIELNTTAGWHLGYRSWADNIVNAYLNPTDTERRLDAEMER